MDKKNIKVIYLMGIGGIAMGTLATMLKERGYAVTGADGKLYPPMSTHLESLQIPLYEGYDPGNLRRAAPDLVVIGNVIRRDNPEAQYVLNNGLPYLSMAEAVAEFFIAEHESVVLAGTHGKTTCTALAGWVLDSAGTDPSALVGGFLKNWSRSFRLGRGRWMAIEGDEYDTAFFDKGPKFLHYRPKIGVLTSVEFDHADIFADFDAVMKAFRSFTDLIPEDGVLIVNGDDPNCLEAARGCRGRMLTYGQGEKSDWRLLDAAEGEGEVRVTYRNPEGEEHSFVSPLPGLHNAGNALAVRAALSFCGISEDAFRRAIREFKGVKRRQDVLGEVRGVMVMDDFAHHPTAVRETIRAVRRFYPSRRLIAAFDPRTNSSKRNVFQQDYVPVFDDADRILIRQPEGLDAIPENQRMDARRLAADVAARGNDARFYETVDEMLEDLIATCRPGDLVLCMSNGSFDGLPSRLLKGLKQNETKLI